MHKCQCQRTKNPNLEPVTTLGYLLTLSQCHGSISREGNRKALPLQILTLFSSSSSITEITVQTVSFIRLLQKCNQPLQIRGVHIKSSNQFFMRINAFIMIIYRRRNRIYKCFPQCKVNADRLRKGRNQHCHNR
jgi:hypothetical protein